MTERCGKPLHPLVGGTCPEGLPPAGGECSAPERHRDYDPDRRRIPVEPGDATTATPIDLGPVKRMRKRR